MYAKVRGAENLAVEGVEVTALDSESQLVKSTGKGEKGVELQLERGFVFI